MKIIAINVERCSGCRMCELACSLKKLGEFNPARSRVHVIGFDSEFHFPVICFHCERPYCAEVCPTSAITRDKATGLIKILKEKCTGCKLCILACPFGNLVFCSEEGIPANCDLCGGQAECVAVCPTGALELKEVDAAKKLSLSEKVRATYRGTDFIDLLLSLNDRKLSALSF